jgi:hypothetical protein
MELKPGSRWRSAVCDAEFVVVRPAKTPVSLQCGGRPVIPHGEARDPAATPAANHSAGSAAGKRYADPETGLEALCSKAGAGSLSVDGRPIGAQDAKKLPSSD